MSALTIEDAAKHFRGLRALDGVSMHVEEGEIVGLIGPNGSGKTTLLNLASGVLRPTAGRISIGDVDATGHKPHDFARLGVGRTFQQIRLFAEMTVAENVEVGAVARGQDAERVDALLERLRLDADRDRLAVTLALRPAAAGRDRARPRRRPTVPAPRRARRGDERGGVGRAARDDQGRPRRRRLRGPHRRPRPAPDHASVRADPRARGGKDDLRGNAPRRSGATQRSSRPIWERRPRRRQIPERPTRTRRRRRMMRRRLLTMLGLLCVLGLAIAAAGCGGGSGDSGDEATPPADTGAPADTGGGASRRRAADASDRLLGRALRRVRRLRRRRC